VQIYLDHNSTTPVAPEVAEAMAEALRAGYANPASQHAAGRCARRALEEAREGIAEILGAKTTGMDADQLIFTSGGTEANNLAILGLGGTGGSPTSAVGSGRVVISAIEHPSVVGPAEALARRGWQIDRIRVTRDGVIELDHARELLAAAGRWPPTISLVSVMLANNETGVLQPVGELARFCDEQQIPLHTDAVQVAGKLPLDFRQLGASAMTITAHKFHGPRGVGALVVRHGAQLTPLLHGGFQQAGLRPGTEDVALAIGMFSALKLWQNEAGQRASRMTALRDRLEAQLLAGDPQAVVSGARANRLPHTSNVAFVGVNRQALLMALDLAGVACSTGSACASGSSEPSPVLRAMGCEEGVIEGALRLSLGATTTAAEVDEAARRILLTVHELRQREN
jgi:cysteine desulfurase